MMQGISSRHIQTVTPFKTQGGAPSCTTNYPFASAHGRLIKKEVKSDLLDDNAPQASTQGRRSDHEKQPPIKEVLRSTQEDHHSEHPHSAPTITAWATSKDVAAGPEYVLFRTYIPSRLQLHKPDASASPTDH